MEILRNMDPIELVGKRQSSENGSEVTKVRIRPRVPALEGCRSIDNFTYLRKIDEGSYGIVFKAQNNQTGEIVAIKKIKLEKEKEGFPITSLREINSMISFDHPNIVHIKEVVYGRTLDKIFVVMEYIDHELKSLLEDRKFMITHGQVKKILKQLLLAVAYMHSRWTIHRDLKTSNLLIDNNGTLKVCDFGLARKFADPLRPYTHMVVTLWYRAPELLLGTNVYTPAIDIWSVGCVFAELLLREPLFMGKNEQDQIEKIFRLLGTPPETMTAKLPKLKAMLQNLQAISKKHQNKDKIREKFPLAGLPGDAYLSDLGVDFMKKLLALDPEERITATQALAHPWFKEEPLEEDIRPLAKTDSTREAEREANRKKRKQSIDEEQIKQREEIHEGEQRFDAFEKKEKDYNHILGQKIE